MATRESVDTLRKNVRSMRAYDPRQHNAVVKYAAGKELTKMMETGRIMRLSELAFFSPGGPGAANGNARVTLDGIGRVIYRDGRGEPSTETETAEIAQDVDTYLETEEDTLPKPAEYVSHVSSERVPNGNGTSAATKLREGLEELLAGSLKAADVDEARVRAIVGDMLADLPVRKQDISVKIGDLPAIELTDQHRLFPLLVAVLSAKLPNGNRIPLCMVGPAGSGKSTAAHSAADALGLAYYGISVGPQTSEARLLGYMDAKGEYVRTVFRDAFEHGGVCLLDEVDAGHPGVLTVLNAALANGTMAFPDGMVSRHVDFVPVAAANTFGTGADRQYVGRNQLDAAFLDRFFFLEWPYDDALEARLCGIQSEQAYVKLVASGYDAEGWLRRVRAVRNAIGKVKHVVSPRASMYGAVLLDIVPKTYLEEGLLWKGLGADQRKQIEGGIR